MVVRARTAGEAAEIAPVCLVAVVVAASWEAQAARLATLHWPFRAYAAPLFLASSGPCEDAPLVTWPARAPSFLLNAAVTVFKILAGV